MAPPTCTIIAGPNGAGKTAFALRYLPTVAGHRRFVNADLIAAGRSPLAPDAELVQTSRLYIRGFDAHLGKEHDFAFETTLTIESANTIFAAGVPMTESIRTPAPETLQSLEALRAPVRESLDCKRQLTQHAAVWRNGRVQTLAWNDEHGTPVK